MANFVFDSTYECDVRMFGKLYDSRPRMEKAVDWIDQVLKTGVVVAALMAVPSMSISEVDSVNWAQCFAISGGIGRHTCMTTVPRMQVIGVAV